MANITGMHHLVNENTIAIPLVPVSGRKQTLYREAWRKRPLSREIKHVPNQENLLRNNFHVPAISSYSTFDISSSSYTFDIFGVKSDISMSKLLEIEHSGVARDFYQMFVHVNCTS